MDDLLRIVLLGILEGITEFLPISSTGHLLVATRLLDAPELLDGPFIFAIQFGAVIALLAHHAPDFMRLLRRQPGQWPLWRALLVAFAPAAAAGFALGGSISNQILDGRAGPAVVAIALIIGGVIMIIVERRLPPPSPTESSEIAPLSIKTALLIGLCQLIAFLPGVSRAGASIVGGLLMGLNRPQATRFSFMLAIPTIAGAAIYSTGLHASEIQTQQWATILLGIVVSALTAWFSIRWLIRFVSSNRFTAFAWYRMVAGIGILLLYWSGSIS